MEKVKKIIESKSFHILLIILGSVLILSSAFSQNYGMTKAIPWG